MQGILPAHPRQNFTSVVLLLTGTSYMSILTKSVAFENGFADKSDTSIAK